MKITDYAKINTLEVDNIFIVDGVNGTKSILAKNASNGLFNMLDEADFMSKMSMDAVNTTASVSTQDKILIGADGELKAMLAKDAFFSFIDEFCTWPSRNCIYRGTLFDGAPSDADVDSLRNKSGKGFFLGDGWKGTSGTKACRIGHFYYGFVNSNGSRLKQATLMTLNYTIGQDKVFDTNIWDHAYYGSNVRTFLNTDVKNGLTNDWGSDIINPEVYINIPSQVDYTSKKVSAVRLANAGVELFSIPMLFGYQVVGQSLPNITCSKKVAVMDLNHYFINLIANNAFWTQSFDSENPIVVNSDLGSFGRQPSSSGFLSCWFSI